MTGMNWLWLVIGIGVGAVGQRWLGRRHRQHSRLAEPRAQSALVQPPGNSPSVDETPAVPGPLPASSEAASDVVSGEAANDEKLLWLAYVRALERAQFQGGFLARAAHELRSPLSSLMGLQQLILADLCDDAEEERQCVAQSYEASQNLHSLMDQLIRIAKLEQGSQRLDIQSIALDLLLEDVESFVQLQVADRNARLHLELPAQTVYAKADYNSLRQVLVMLVEVALIQKAFEIQVTLTPGDAGATLNFWADQPLIPLQELKVQLQDEADAELWNRDNLMQLKQSLAQDADANFVPHRLSPGMVLLISQLLLDLNGGTLKLVPGAGDTAPEFPQDKTATGDADRGLEQGCALELWLPSA